MHMARLYDTSKQPNEYSLAKLSNSMHNSMLKMRNSYIAKMRKSASKQQLSQIKTYLDYNEGKLTKIDMKTLFQYKKVLKSGEEGKTLIMPTIEELHTTPKYISDWIGYSVLDAESTYYLRDALAEGLKTLSCKSATHTNPLGYLENNYDLYMEFWRPFGELMTDMERNGFKVNTKYLQKIQAEAQTDIKKYENAFINWVRSVQKDANEFNPGSVAQMQQLLFAPAYRKQFWSNTGLKVRETTEWYVYWLKIGYSRLKMCLCLAKKGVIKEGRSEPLKKRDMTIEGLGFPALGYTASGLPACDQHIIKAMLDKEENGDSWAVNRWTEKFGSKGAKAFEEALQHFVKYKSIETLLQTYILPLQTAADKDNRIHCSLNFNTDTGRISSRRPNLQNQPAYDKDVYAIRSAFVAEKGKKLIVADYGQLELRILANITNCESMIEAFRLGGDFHSRTALSMYDEVQEAVEKGECLLEWNNSKGEPPAPLLKDKFAPLRKKAKTMNFSIAYGKSASGFSKDWNCSVEEAKQTLKKWYDSRPEVEKWQEAVKKTAVEKAYTQTLMGRYRNLSNKIQEKRSFGHGLRAAINTPIQGGAADIVIAGMVKINRSQRLKDLGFKILLQIHDEIVLVPV